MTDTHANMLLSDDTQALLMLSTPLALAPDCQFRPLSLGQWNALALAIRQSPLKRPGRLLGSDAGRLGATLGVEPALAERIARLLDRGAQLGPALAILEERAIWLLTRADSSYPRRWKQRLKDKAPVVLFGSGALRLTDRDGVAVVGSRDVAEPGRHFALQLGQRCASQGLTLISGAARGVDRIAMNGSLEEGGSSVGIVADSLERILAEKETRRFIDEDRLCLLSPYLPTTPFSVGNAMGRNKCIYASARWAIVVDSALKKGGTWEGAVENLKAGWTRLLVRDGDQAAPGNAELIRRGGIALSLAMLEDNDLPATLDRLASGRGPALPAQDDLLDWADGGVSDDLEELIPF